MYRYFEICLLKISKFAYSVPYYQIIKLHNQFPLKRLSLFLILVTLLQSVHAQSKEDSIPVYQRFPVIPPFSIMSAPDSTKFSKEDLKKKRPVIIIVFSPDCEHCKHFTKELLANYHSVKKAQIIMASALNYDIIKKFYTENKIADYPHIIMGRDGTAFFSTFFKVRSFPAVFVYNKKGKFIKRFDGSVTVDKIAAEL